MSSGLTRRMASSFVISFSLAMSTAILNVARSEEHTSELQSRPHLVCRLLLEKKKIDHNAIDIKAMQLRGNDPQMDFAVAIVDLNVPLCGDRAHQPTCVTRAQIELQHARHQCD